jgi:hypothetical protein
MGGGMHYCSKPRGKFYSVVIEAYSTWHVTFSWIFFFF